MTKGQTNTALLWVAAMPAATAVLARISDDIQLTALFSYFVEHWKDVAKVVWDNIFGWLQQWISVASPTEPQRSLLTFGAMLVSTSLFSVVVQKFAVRTEIETAEVDEEGEPVITHKKRVERFYFVASYTTLLGLFAIVPVIFSIEGGMPARGKIPDWYTHTSAILMVTLFVGISGFPPFVRFKKGIQSLTLPVIFLVPAFVLAALGRLDVPVGTPWGWEDTFLCLLMAVLQTFALFLAQRVSPSSLSRVVLFALAMFLVDRMVFVLEPLNAYFAQMRNTAP